MFGFGWNYRKSKGDRKLKLCSQCRYFYHGHKNEPSLCTNKKSKRFPNKISKNGHNHACALFRPIKSHNHSLDLLPEVKKKDGSHYHPIAGTLAEIGHLHYIENLRGVYAGREIWVLATGPSLDDLPKNFLAIDEMMEPDENGNRPPKISIAVKEAGMVFPGCTYNMWPFRDYPFRHIYLPRGMIHSSFNKFIFSILKIKRENYYGKQAAKATYIRYTQGGTIKNMKTMCDSIVAGNSSIYYGIGTIAHLAIATALVMGASKISLVGCDHGTIDGKLRAQSIKGGYGWQTPVEQGYEDMKVGTNFLANYFRDHNVEIVRYYHGKGYEAVGEVVNDEEIIKRAEGAWKDIIKKGTDWEKTKEKNAT